MSPIYPIGQRIVRISGLLERVDERPHAKHYSAVMELTDGKIMLLAQNDLVELNDWPDDAAELPAQMVDGDENVEKRLISNAIDGCLISNAFVLHRPAESVSGMNGPQLFLVLDYQHIMGIVPAQIGHILHIETALTCPLIRPDNTLVSLDGKPISLEDLI